MNAKLSVATYNLKQEDEARCQVEERLNQLKGAHKDQELRASAADARCAQLTSNLKRLQEEKRAVVIEHQSSQVQLHEAIAKTMALEDHIKVRGGISVSLSSNKHSYRKKKNPYTNFLSDSLTQSVFPNERLCNYMA